MKHLYCPTHQQHYKQSFLPRIHKMTSNHCPIMLQVSFFFATKENPRMPPVPYSDGFKYYKMELPYI